jgi:hypothetical protein
MQRLLEYTKRYANIYLTTWPGNNTNRKVELLEELFRLSSKALLTSGEEFWLDFGTLLGYHRDHGIMRHEKDVDFSMHEKSFDKIWSMRGSFPGGLKLYDSSKKHYGPKLFFNHKGFDVDIYFYEDLGDSVRSYEKSKYANYRQAYPKSLMFPLVEVEFLGSTCYIPKHTKEFLERTYGYIGADAKRDPITGLWSKK